MARDVRTLLFSTLYPSGARPLHGIFVETRLRELLARGGVQTRVVAPVPWFWSTHPRHGRYAAMARTPAREVHNGIDVRHPAYLTLPRGRTPGSLPLIVLPHGGPASRDEPGFDWWPQALASRGYAVLQPNFRGSTGLGLSFQRAGPLRRTS